jgi:general stress protein CsbA
MVSGNPLLYPTIFIQFWWLNRSCYVAVILYVVGMVLMGAAFQKHLTIAAFIIGWGLVEIATMVNTVAVCEYFYYSYSILT